MATVNTSSSINLTGTGSFSVGGQSFTWQNSAVDLIDVGTDTIGITVTFNLSGSGWTLRYLSFSDTTPYNVVINNLGGAYREIEYLKLGLNSVSASTSTVNLTNTSVDTIVGGGGADNLTLGAVPYLTINLYDGNDTIRVGAAEVDYIRTGNGNDRVDLGSGGYAPNVDLGSGNDSLLFTKNVDIDAFTYVNAGSGVDTFGFTGFTTGVIFSLQNIGTQNTGAGRVIAVGFENLTGTAYNDRLTGNDQANSINGGVGNDLINGAEGNDRLDGAAGIDTLIGGSGNDTYLVDNAGDIVDELNDAGSGADTVQSSISFNLSQTARVLGFVENLTLLGTSNVNGTGNGLNNVLTGNSGNNILDGGSGNDTLIGGAGTDTLIGGLGNDVYALGTENDVVNDSSGIDAITSAITRSLGSYSTIENLTLLGTAAINGTGNSLANTIVGNSGNNIINGGSGNDTLAGGLGNDRLMGDVGNDMLTGGTGLDTFVFNTALNASTNVDRIVDFSVADDSIWLENGIMTALGTVGTFSSAAFVRNTTGLAQDAADRIIYESDTGNLYYDSNGNAAGGSVLIGVLSANLLLTHNDFSII